jgi:hypothetical protein
MATNSWIAAGAGNASVDANWSLGHAPAIGEDVDPSSASQNNINWDITTQVASIVGQIPAGGAGSQVIAMSAACNVAGAVNLSSAHATYTLTLQTGTSSLAAGPMTLGTRGCFSQTGTGGNASVSSLTQSGAGSIITGKVDATFTCAGDFIRTGGSLAGSVLYLIMTKNGATYSVYNGDQLYALRASGNIAVERTAGTYNVLVQILVVDSSKTLTINSGSHLVMYCYSWFAITIDGYLNGPGDFYINPTLGGTTNAVMLKNINTSVTVRADSASSSNTVVPMSANWDINGPLSVYSNHASYTMAVDQKGYRLTCTTLTDSTRGIIMSSVAGAEIVTPGAVVVAATAALDMTNIAKLEAYSLDASAGTYTEGKELVIIGAGGSVKLAAGQKIYNLIAKAGLRLLSNVTVDNLYAHVGDVIKGAYAVTLTKPEMEYTGLRRPIVRSLRDIEMCCTGLADGWLKKLGGLL